MQQVERSQGELEAHRVNPLQRGMVAEVVHPNGYRERVKARATRVERRCDMCEATIPKGELCGVQAPGLFNCRFCWRCCEPLPAAAVERERAERQAIAEQHELAFAVQCEVSDVAYDGQFRLDRWRWDFALYPVGSRTPTLLLDVQGATRAGHKGGHTNHDGYTRDCRKLSYAVEQGYWAIFVTGEMVQSGEAMQIVKRVLAAPTDRAQRGEQTA